MLFLVKRSLIIWTNFLFFLFEKEFYHQNALSQQQQQQQQLSAQLNLKNKNRQSTSSPTVLNQFNTNNNNNKSNLYPQHHHQQQPSDLQLNNDFIHQNLIQQQFKHKTKLPTRPPSPQSSPNNQKKTNLLTIPTQKYNSQPNGLPLLAHPHLQQSPHLHLPNFNPELTNSTSKESKIDLFISLTFIFSDFFFLKRSILSTAVTTTTNKKCK